MKAVVYKKPLPIDHQESLLDMEIPEPKIETNDLLIDIKAISVNPADVKIRASSTPKDKYRILGWDVSGVVIDKGENVKNFNIGDEVYYAGAINRDGCYSERQVVDYRIVAKKPKNISFSDAAAVPLTALTAWEALFDRLNIDRNEESCILIIGGAGGVGSIAIQMIKAMTKLTVIATASRNESKEWVKSLGADYVINHFDSLEEQIHSEKIQAPKYVFSTSNTDSYLDQIVNIIEPQGKIVLIDDPKSLDILKLKGKSLTICWEFMFTRSLFETDDISNQGKILDEVAILLDKGKIKTTKNKEFYGINASNLKEAHQIIESNRTVGKIVLNKDI
ncbi:zinc-binding alcohol dehydrogenase family protein [Xenorhabdus sp. TH1]|uniref:zinc-binding alcohol dehydrogenase family protein n=1 Tax=Xenorhabdus sp. TH1 TaxID=3130166 RepID=UPI0030CBD151